MKEQVLDLYENGYNEEEISNMLGVAIKVVENYLVDNSSKHRQDKTSQKLKHKTKPKIKTTKRSNSKWVD